MKPLLKKLSVSAVCFSTAQLFAAPGAVVSVKRDSHGITLQVNPGVLRLEIYAPGIIRVTYAEQDELPDLTSLTVVVKPERTKWKLSDSKNEIVLRTDEIEARVNHATGAVSFCESSGRLLLQEAAEGREIAPATVAGDAGTSCAQTFETAQDEGIYGLGQHQRGAWNYGSDSGVNVRLAQANTDVGFPVMTSSMGYMLLWDNPAVTSISASAAGESGAGQKVLRWSSEVGKAIDYYFCYGDGTIDTAMKVLDVRKVFSWSGGAIELRLDLPVGGIAGNSQREAHWLFGQMGTAIVLDKRREGLPRPVSEIHRRQRAAAELRLVEVRVTNRNTII